MVEREGLCLLASVSQETEGENARGSCFLVRSRHEIGTEYLRTNNIPGNL